jgi:RNA polymerase sigma-70 factor (ECF subfamily)
VVRIKSKRNIPSFINGAVGEELSDELLAAQVARGDSKAFEILYDRYAAIILGFAFKVNADEALAEDVLQETFWRVWRRAGTYHPHLGSFTAWLFRIARNLIIDHHRKKNARIRDLKTNNDDQASNIDRTPDPDADVPEQAHSFLRNQQVRAALGTLPEAQRKVIEMAYFYGMTRQEIAEATGEALGTIHTRARLALQKLRRELEDQGFED